MRRWTWPNRNPDAKRRQHLPKSLSAAEHELLETALARHEVEQRLWISVRTSVFERADYFCEVEMDGMRCKRRAVDGHHVKERSQGGEHHPDNVVALCRHHHDSVDWPFRRGKLVIEAHGAERFTFRVEYWPDKFARRGQGQQP